MIEIDDERFDKIIVWLEMLRAKLQQDGLSSYESTVDDIICELEISQVVMDSKKNKKVQLWI